MIEIAVAVVAVIIAVGVLLVVLEANPANDIVDADPRHGARGSSARSRTSSRSTTRKLEVAVNWGLAVLVYVLVGRTLADLLRRPRP